MQNRFFGASINEDVKSLLLFVLVIALAQSGPAQNTLKLDSLLMINQVAKPDTFKVNILNEISDELWRTGNYTGAKQYADDALMLANKINYKSGVSYALINIGLSFFKLGKYSEALNNYLSALKLFEEIKGKKGIASAYHNIATYYKHLGNYPDALKNQTASLAIHEEIGNKEGIASSFNNFGYIHLRLGNPIKALQYHLSSLKIYEELDFKSGIANASESVGNIYAEQGKDPEALKYYLASLKIREKIGDKNGLATSYINIGIIHYNQNNNEEALKYFKASCKINESLGDLRGIAKSYQTISIINYTVGNYTEALKNCNISLKAFEEIGEKKGIIDAYKLIGIIYQELGNYSDALINYEKALKLSKEIGDKAGTCETLENLGSLYIRLNLPNESGKCLQEAFSLANEIGYVDLIMNVYISLTKLDSLTGNHKQALGHYKMYAAFKDSLLNESNSKMIAEMKAKYETENKDKEIQKLESEKQIDSLRLRVQIEALTSIKSEKDKFQMENLYNLKQVELLDNERRLQQLELEKKQVDYVAQKAETERKHGQVMLLSKESEIHKLEIKKQTLVKNYLIGGLIFLCVLGCFAYSNYSTRQKLKLQTLRNKIASDLHDDVGSTLSSISIFSQIAQEQSKEVIPLLDTIGDSSRKMLDAMADIVWTINPENDQFEKIILRMRSFAYELLGAKGIDFEFQADEDIAKIKLPMEVRKNLYLIFKEATNNMVKYADASKALFAIKEEKNNLSMMIRDNGKGFDMNKLTEGNGIKNMKKRAEEIGAKLWIESFPGSGTNIQLRIAV